MPGSKGILKGKKLDWQQLNANKTQGVDNNSLYCVKKDEHGGDFEASSSGTGPKSMHGARKGTINAATGTVNVA